MGFLEHAIEAVQDVLDGRASVLFVPLASSHPDAYATVVRDALARIDVRVTSLHEASDAAGAIRDAKAVFVGGGNSFRLLRGLRQMHALEALRDRVNQGVPYLGASAGSNLACPSIRTTNDMPIVEAAPLSALGLIPFQLNPHYLDSDPGSSHQGETRQQRIEEFLEENDVPVLGLREGAWLRVDGKRAVLSGANAGRLFRRHEEPADVPIGADLSFLLDSELGMEGGRWYQGWFEPPKIRLALARHKTGKLAELAPDEFDREWEPPSTFLDALAALGDRERIEAEAPKWLQAGTFAEPFALRALGVARDDQALLRQALERFEALELSWHVAQTRRLL
jgi:dipeptidase E